MSSKVEIQTNPATATPSLSPPSSSASTSVPPSSNKSTTTTKNNDNGNDNNKTSAQQDEVPMKRKNSATSNGSSASTTPPKRHRPILNLGVPDNADVALRIVSPGLPPLINESMKTTVQLLKQIQQQQKSNRS